MEIKDRTIHNGIFATSKYNTYTELSAITNTVDIEYNDGYKYFTTISLPVLKLPNIATYVYDYYYYIDDALYFKDILEFNFNPSLSGSSLVDNNSGFVESGVYDSGYDRFFTNIDRSTKLDFIDYTYSGTTEIKDVLSNMDYKHNIYCDTELTLRSYNQWLSYSDGFTGYYSYCSDSTLDKQHIEIYKDNIKQLECYIDIDFDSNNTGISKYNNGTNNILSHGNPNIAEYPFGLPNINGNDIKITGYYYDGSWHTTSQDSTIIFNGCNLSFDITVNQTVCDCTCIDKDTGEVVDCDDDNGGCSNSPYAETECWNTATNEKCNFDTDDPADFICRDVNTHEQCVTDNPDDTSCVWDSDAGAFVGDVSRKLCHSPNIDWVDCTSHITQVPITLTVENIDNLRTYFSRSGITLTNTYELNILECKSRFTGINVAWENKLGGVDYHLFTLADEKTISSKKQLYDFSKTETIDGLVVEKEYNKETLVLSNISTVEILATTNWLNQNDINGMEDLFESSEVYIKYDDEWRYVINSTNKAIIYNKKRKGLKKYQVKFILSEKIRR